LRQIERDARLHLTSLPSSVQELREKARFSLSIDLSQLLYYSSTPPWQPFSGHGTDPLPTQLPTSPRVLIRHVDPHPENGLGLLSFGIEKSDESPFCIERPKSRNMFSSRRTMWWRNKEARKRRKGRTNRSVSCDSRKQ